MKRKFILALIFFLPYISYAAPMDDLGTLGKWIGDKWVNWGVSILISLAVLAFLYGALQFIISKDNQDTHEMGKRHMINALIGIFVMVSIWGFVNLLLNTFDFNGSTDISTNSFIKAPFADDPI